MHIGLIQLSFAVNIWCIISGAGDPQGGLMSLANAGKAHATGPRLTALPLEQAAALLRRSGSQRVTVESLRADLADGAPANADGTLNLIAYGAWLVQTLAKRQSQHGD